MVFVVAIVAVALIAVRPKGLPMWAWPLGAAVLIVALRYEAPAAAFEAIVRQWNVLLFILGLMGLSAAAEESGAFAWLTDVLLARAGGSRRRLFVLLFVAGALTTLVLSNDATAIVLTPIVYAAVSRRGGDPMPYLFACIFVAGTASFGLPFSNPANVLILPRAQIVDYVVHLGPPEIVAIGLNLALFLLIFRRSLRGRYAFEPVEPPSASAVRTLWAFAGVGTAYAVALTFSWPLGPVAAIAAIATLAIARVGVASAARHVSWSTFALLGALFVLLDAVAHAGFVPWVLAQLETTARYGNLAVIAWASGGAALASNLLNNLPVAIAASYVVAHDPSQQVAYPLIVGVDLGPNLTTTGSLATILWIAVLAKRGVRVNPLEYLRLGAIVVPPTIAVAAVWLWLLRDAVR
ncbi:MAG TPA: SLC13 family permease [Candidatus Tumulicola sp.]